MTFGILIFPGAHGDKELKRVLEEVYGKSVRTIWNRETNLSKIDVLFIPGGVPHSAVAHTPCRLLDVFHPVREEYRTAPSG